jgi:membrane protease YdiL (CAAX protease family)
MQVAPWQRSLFVLLEALCIPMGLLLGWLLAVNPLETLEWSLSGILLGAVGAAPILLLAGWIATSRFAFTRSLVELVAELVIPFFRGWPLAEMALVAAVAGFGEELLFRGALQAAASDTYGLVPGLICASVAFGLVHFLNLAYAIFATIIGFYCGWLWLASGNLLVPMVAHGLYDFLVLVFLTRVGIGRSDPPRA